MNIIQYLNDKLDKLGYERIKIQTDLLSYTDKETNKSSQWFRFGKFLVYTGKNPPALGFDIDNFYKETIPNTNFNFVEVTGW